MNIFADLHHAGLAHSFRLLAKRLGAHIYFPIGEDWFTKGYWDIAKPYRDNPGTVKQYLQIKPEHKVINSPPLNTIVSETSDYYEIKDHYHGDTYKAITFEQFCSMDIDILIGSIPAHWKTYLNLIKAHKPKAKLICHAGNIGWEQESFLKSYKIDNFLASVKPFKSPVKHTIFYHQEAPVVPYKPFNNDIQYVSSFVHLLPLKENYMTLQKYIGTDFKTRAFGADAPDGLPGSLNDMFTLMQSSMFGYHNKPGGDGFGHVIHSWMMIGRPVIINLSDYYNKLVGDLLIPGVTCIDLSHGVINVADMLRKIANDKEYYDFLCLRARKIFRQFVNYEREGEELKKFFADLV